MKQTATILLMLLLAFNWLGYRLLSGYLEHSADIALEKKIDNSEYDEANLIEIRVPLNAPYLSSGSTSFERFDGEIELKGTHYKYVKRKVVDGELVLLCLPNEDKTRLETSRADFFKLVNDLNQTSQSKGKSVSLKSFTSDYKQESNCWTIQPAARINLNAADISFSNLSSGYNSIPKQPPRA